MKRAHKVRPASLDELEKIVDALPDRYRLMALLAAWCAMRFDELAELRRGDIDVRTNRVSITRGVVRVGGNFVVGSPKSHAGVRDVAIPPHLVPAVKAHLKNHTDKDKNALLFPAAADSIAHMAPSTLYKRLLPGPGRRLAATTSAGTTSATPALSSPPRPARPSPSSWAGSATRLPGRRCATSTPRLIATPRLPAA